MARVWDQYLSERDKQHLALSSERPPARIRDVAAVLSVDNYRAAVGDERLPLLESVKDWPSSTGEDGWAALDHIRTLFAQARAAAIPIIHVTGLAEEDSGMPGWAKARDSGRATAKRTITPQRRVRRYDIVDQAAPLPGEVVLKKNAPSAFFGTPLAGYLMGNGISTLIVCGESVSGCVRASVVDACSYRLNVIVVEDCVYDRHEACRAINLFDMNQKYASVISLGEALKLISDYQARI